ncbi:MAG: hypothetical protein FWG53_11755 [Clostridiales bacterium]|nr:hypothetical protein [Clostridiales bacterium]
MSGKVEQVGQDGLDKFGLFDPPDDYGYFRVAGDWVYTIYDDLRKGDGQFGSSNPLLPVRVNIKTKRFETLE